MNSVVFRDATVIDGSGAPPFRATVRVDGNRISSITIASAAPGRTDPATATEAQSVPDGAEIVDCQGATLMPGMIEPHAHLSFVD